MTSGTQRNAAANDSCEAAAGYDGPTGVGSPVGLGAFVPAGQPGEQDSAPTISGRRRAGPDAERPRGQMVVQHDIERRPVGACSTSGTSCTAVAGATASTFLLRRRRRPTIRVLKPPPTRSGTDDYRDLDADRDGHQRTPAITSISPGSGPTGSSVTIAGAALTGATSVHFGTSTASFSDPLRDRNRRDGARR